MDGWMNGWMDEWMDGWLITLLCFYKIISIITLKLIIIFYFFHLQAGRKLRNDR